MRLEVYPHRTHGFNRRLSESWMFTFIRLPSNEMSLSEPTVHDLTMRVLSTDDPAFAAAGLEVTSVVKAEQIAVRPYHRRPASGFPVRESHGNTQASGQAGPAARLRNPAESSASRGGLPGTGRTAPTRDEPDFQPLPHGRGDLGQGRDGIAPVRALLHAGHGRLLRQDYFSLAGAGARGEARGS